MMRLPRGKGALKVALTSAALLTLTVGAASGSQTAQAQPVQSDQASVEVRTWSNAPAQSQPRPGTDGGVLLDGASAEALLALCSLGASAVTVRSATRKEA